MEEYRKASLNRFYYSEKQDQLIKAGNFDNDPIFINYIKVDSEYKRYIQWCSIDGTTCNWDDAVLVCTMTGSFNQIMRKVKMERYN